MYYIYTGFPRVYRHLVQGVKSTNISKDKQLIVRNTIKEAIRFPDTALTTLRQSDTLDFIVHYTESIVASASTKVPPFFLIFGRLMLKKTPFGSVIDFMKKK